MKLTRSEANDFNSVLIEGKLAVEPKSYKEGVGVLTIENNQFVQCESSVDGELSHEKIVSHILIYVRDSIAVLCKDLKVGYRLRIVGRLVMIDGRAWIEAEDVDFNCRSTKDNK